MNRAATPPETPAPLVAAPQESAWEAALSKTISSRSVVFDNLDPIFSLLRHELGNPINSLKVTLEVLIQNYDYFDEAKRLDFLRRAHEQVARQHKFLDAMKAYTRTGVDEIREIPFLPAWNSFLHALRLKIIENGIDFKHVTPSEPVWIVANNAAMQSLLQFIADNAIEALRKTESPLIEIKTWVDGSYLVITIRDNGCGVKTEHMAKVFTPMFTTKEGRAGMGLSLAQRLIDKMGGWIEITSQPQRGTKVNIRIRLADRINGLLTEADADAAPPILGGHKP
jgi:signal transduction histidine kinase